MNDIYAIIKNRAYSIAARVLRRLKLPGLSEKPEATQYPGILGRIHRNDFMIGGTTTEMLEHYTRVGLNAYSLLEEALSLVNRTPADVSSVLDFGCGYGRVTRILVQKMGAQKVSVFDVDPGAPLFCAKEFGVKPVLYTSSWNSIPFDAYDLIWVGSVFTHLSETFTQKMLGLLLSILNDGGLLVFTTHGDEALMRLRRGDYGPRFQSFDAQVRKEVETRGFSYIPFSRDEMGILPYGYESNDMGMTWVTESYVENLMQRISQGQCRLLKFVPKGWDYHQDVFMYHCPQADLHHIA